MFLVSVISVLIPTLRTDTVCVKSLKAILLLVLTAAYPKGTNPFSP